MLKLAFLAFVGLATVAATEINALEITKAGVALVSNDAEKQAAFYRDVVGLKPLTSDTNANGVRRARFQAGTGVLEILAPPQEAPHFREEVEGAMGIRAVALFLSGSDQLSQRMHSHGLAEVKFVSPNGGMKVARVKDPDGNFLELIFPDNPTPANLNHIAVALRMPDVERSKVFYGKTLGLKELPPHGDPKNLSYGYAIGDSSIFVKHVAGDTPDHGNGPTAAVGIRAITLTVGDLDAVERFLKSRGVKIVVPARGDKGRSLTVADPDGNYLVFVSGS